MTRILVLLLITLLACSETEERPLPGPEPPVPTITIANRGYGWGRSFAGGTTVERDTFFSIASDIPMPADTYILVNDQLFRMEEGETELEIVFTETCPYITIDYEQPTFMGKIKPADERLRHLPYRRGGIQLPEGYRFNPYKVGGHASITTGLWCE